MQPDAVAAFVEEFVAAWNQLCAEASAGVAVRERELETVRRKLAGLVEAVADGLRASGLQERLDSLEARRTALEAEIARAAAPVAARLHPNLSEIYRERVARLREALAADGGPEIVEAIRTLVDRVEVHPPAGGGKAPRLELIGKRCAAARLADG
jgi:hypothetical protein